MFAGGCGALKRKSPIFHLVWLGLSESEGKIHLKAAQRIEFPRSVLRYWQYSRFLDTAHNPSRRSVRLGR
jgi:hypothetical protein